MVSIAFTDYRPFRLVLGETGPHYFGGPPRHKGVTPLGAEIPLHHFLSIDLVDANLPIRTTTPIRWLPLYYPLKYGFGGPQVQYNVLSDTEIQILHMSDPTPDDEDLQYVAVPHLPDSRAKLVPLEYEEARILGFMTADNYFKPNHEDLEILKRIDRNHLITIGGWQIGVRHAQDVVCRNNGCKRFGRRVTFEALAAIPPVPINGIDDFWHQYQGGHMEFCFGLCGTCGTVIAFNRAD